MHISNKCSVGLHCLLFIHEYGEENKVTSEMLSLSTGTNAVIIRNILSSLKKAEIIKSKEGGGVILAKEPTAISIYDVYGAIEPDFAGKLIGIHTHPNELCPVGRNINEVLNLSYFHVQNDLCESLKKSTLQEIIDNFHCINH